MDGYADKVIRIVINKLRAFNQLNIGIVCLPDDLTQCFAVLFKVIFCPLRLPMRRYISRSNECHWSVFLLLPEISNELLHVPLI